MVEKEEIEISISSQNEYSKLFDLIKNYPNLKRIEIFWNIYFLEPYDVLTLTMFVIHFKRKGAELRFLFKKESTHKYLDFIGFKSFIIDNYDSATVDLSGVKGTAMPIKRVTKETLTDYIMSTQRFLEFYCPNKDLFMLEIAITELINNVYDHSDSHIDGYVFCQYYPKNDTIKLAVGDLGAGLPGKIKTFLEDADMNNEDAVLWAFEENKSIQSTPQNRGRGLNTVSSFVKSNKGSLLMHTHNVTVCTNYTYDLQATKNRIDNYIGTIIQVTIQVANLDEREDKLYDFDF